ncbi:MAG TPA: PCRF domain-containing protein, partial [Methylomirabilota bacterium]|nr:PCRF domain-containing protein [Methylomirabilota bacterium]
MARLTFREKLDQLETRYDEMTAQLSDPAVIADSARFQKLAKAHAELQEIVGKHRAYKQIEKDLAGAHQMAQETDDAEMRQLAHEEEKQLEQRKDATERELKLLLLPRDPNDEKNVI